MSQNAAPAGAMVGEIPLKVMGPPWVMTMVPMAKRVGSSTEVATMVTSAGVVVVGAAVVLAGTVTVGTTEGAVYTPLVSIEPQPLAFPETVQVVNDA